MAPQSGVGVEGVIGKEHVAVTSDERNRAHHVVEDSLADEVVEVDAYPPRFDAFATGSDGAFILM